MSMNRGHHDALGEAAQPVGDLGSDAARPQASDTAAGIGSQSRFGHLVVGSDVEVAEQVRPAGADCALNFAIGTTAPVERGTVMVLGEAGALFPCRRAYDKRVAGVIAGARAFEAGIAADRPGPAGIRQPIALVGTAHCLADAQYGPIEIGDALTTSPTPGHAMKAVEPLAALGAMLGKALCPLSEGQGLIPILIALH